MEPLPLDQVVRNIDQRLERVEQILPTLATKEELKEAIAPLATKEELKEAIANAIAPLATREGMRAATSEEGDRTRRHFDVVAESLRTEIRLVAEGCGFLHERGEAIRTELKGDVGKLDRRVTRLEKERPTRRPGR